MYKISKVFNNKDKMDYVIYNERTEKSIAKYLTKEDANLICDLLNDYTNPKKFSKRETLKEEYPKESSSKIKNHWQYCRALERIDKINNIIDTDEVYSDEYESLLDEITQYEKERETDFDEDEDKVILADNIALEAMKILMQNYIKNSDYLKPIDMQSISSMAYEMADYMIFNRNKYDD